MEHDLESPVASGAFFHHCYHLIIPSKHTTHTQEKCKISHLSPMRVPPTTRSIFLITIPLLPEAILCWVWDKDLAMYTGMLCWVIAYPTIHVTY